MKKTISLLMLLFVVITLSAQEREPKKQLYAKSVINQKAPELVFEEWLGKEPKLKGKFILIDFWATWCKGCVAGIPHMNELSKHFKKKLVVIALSNEKEEAIKAMKEPVIEFYSATDTRSTLANALEIMAIPHAILIDPKGVVRWEGLPGQRGFELTAEVIEEIIQKYK